MQIVEQSRELEYESAGLWKAWSIVLLCMLAYILSFIDRQILALLVGPIRADLHISDTQFGLLNGLAFSIFYATMGIPIAGLSDRSSRPRIIVCGIAVWSAATMACGMARSFGHLFLSRILVGAGEAALSPAAYSLIADLFPRDRMGRALAVYSLGTLLGTGLAFLVGGVVIAAISSAARYSLAGLSFSPWQVTMFIVGAPGIILAIVIGTVVKDPRRARALDPSVPTIASVFRELTSQPGIYVPLLLGFSLAAMALYGLLSWIPAHLMRRFDMGPRQVGLLLGPIAIIAGGGGNLVSGWLVDGFAGKGRHDAPFLVGMIGAAGVALPSLAIGLAPSLGIAIPLVAAALFFAAFPMAPSTVVMQVAAPASIRSRVSAIFLFCNSFIGLALSSALIGFTNDRFFGGNDIGLAMGIVVSIAAVLAIFVLHMGRRPFGARHPFRA
ncbi:spinster family MFS transporter [Gluconacetobacter azotocaptans]|nr:MFS transporter [Gluconacetobacter azotocaptans]GBQ34081.1 major facilitator superfamily transporter [Gluconacetobacter azotocaptans DSM 13594]